MTRIIDEAEVSVTGPHSGEADQAEEIIGETFGQLRTPGGSSLKTWWRDDGRDVSLVDEDREIGGLGTQLLRRASRLVTRELNQRPAGACERFHLIVRGNRRGDFGGRCRQPVHCGCQQSPHPPPPPLET